MTQYLGLQMKQIENNVLVYYEILRYMCEQNKKKNNKKLNFALCKIYRPTVV